METYNSLDWSRLAEPQADQYDTNVILQLAASNTSPAGPNRYQRRPVGTAPSVFDGCVAVRYVYHEVPEFESLATQYPDAPLDHQNIAIAAEYVRTWPIAFTQCRQLLDSIHPALHPEMPLESTEIYRGSLCHSYESLFGTMWATIFCPLGLAEAMVHEVAHQKLRALGVSVESATAIVGNDPSDLYVSPIIKDRLRPLTAVLHAEYSYVHVTALDIAIVKAEHDSMRREVMRGVLETNLTRIEEGYEILRKHFIPAAHGEEFIKSFFNWTERTIDVGRNLLRGNGAGVASRDYVSGPAVESQTLPHIDTSANTLRIGDREVEILMRFKSPGIMLLGNVLSDEECDALIAHCEPRLERSEVVSDADGNVGTYPTRTSQGVMLQRGETQLIAGIEARLETLAHWPVACSEGLQVVRYDVRDEYRAHFDWIDPNLPGLQQHLQHGGQRVATFILYLSNVEAGGATSFPSLGLEIVPRKGAALFFVNTDSQLVPDELTLHAGSSVVKGIKFVANKWLRQRPC